MKIDKLPELNTEEVTYTIAEEDVIKSLPKDLTPETVAAVDGWRRETLTALTPVYGELLKRDGYVPGGENAKENKPFLTANLLGSAVAEFGATDAGTVYVGITNDWGGALAEATDTLTTYLTEGETE